jgi:hypothetical protein
VVDCFVLLGLLRGESKFQPENQYAKVFESHLPGGGTSNRYAPTKQGLAPTLKNVQNNPCKKVRIVRILRTGPMVAVMVPP